jgi:hypothetical protein
MLALRLTAPLDDDHRLVLAMPPEVPPGLYDIVLVLNEYRTTHEAQINPLPVDEQITLELPVHDIGPWPSDLTLRREDLYDEWSR